MGYNVTNQYGAILVNDETTANKPKEIRFITPEYHDKFRLPDGGHVLIGRRFGGVTEHKCTFLDPTHFLLDSSTYHICQFAEMLRTNGFYVVPFPEKRVIWSNIDLDTSYELWKELHEECYPDLDIDYFCDVKVPEVNDEYLDDERMNLDVKVGDEILVIADIGLWHGRRMGYQLIESGNISDCLYASKDCDYNEWYVDRDGEFRSTQTHHDGTHYLTYRKWRADISEDDRDDLLDKIYRGVATKEEIDAVTEKLGGDIGKVYGWDFPDKRLEEKTKNGKER